MEVDDIYLSAETSQEASLLSGRYELLELLGVGGMARVYRAHDIREDRFVAVKVLLPRYAHAPALRLRFEAEGSTMMAVDHPHIVPVLEVNTDGDRVYMVMELMHGGTLSDLIATVGPLGRDAAIEIMEPVLGAVGRAHEKGVIHRDLKPENILLDGEGTPHITDFGIARVVDRTVPVPTTQTGMVMGTAGYMAPEQRSSARSVDERSDVYSLGATLFFVVTGRQPFDLFAVDDDDEVVEGIPPDLLGVIRRATEYRREQRFGSVTEMAEALVAGPVDPEAAPPLPPPQGESDSSGPSTLVLPPSAASPARPWWLPAGIAVLGTLAIVGALSGGLQQEPSSSPPSVEVVTIPEGRDATPPPAPPSREAAPAGAEPTTSEGVHDTRASVAKPTADMAKAAITAPEPPVEAAREDHSPASAAGVADPIDAGPDGTAEDPDGQASNEPSSTPVSVEPAVVRLEGGADAVELVDDGGSPQPLGTVAPGRYEVYAKFPGREEAVPALGLDLSPGEVVQIECYPAFARCSVLSR